MKTITKSARLSMKTKTNTLLGAVLFLLIIAAAAPSANAQAVFSADFNTGIPPQVTGPATLVDVYGWNGLGASGYVFDGSMLWNTSRTEPTRVTLTGLPAHSSVRIGFLLALIDSWDGIGDGSGPDSFNVIVDDVIVFSHVFNATGGTSDYIPPPGVLLSSGTQLGFRSDEFFDRDQAYDMSLEPAFFDIPHSASTLTVEFFASGPRWQGNNDESWAIDQLRICIASSNQAPLATDDFYGMNQASSLSIPAPGVLANDSDSDEDPLTVELVSGPANAASFQLNPDGSFSYTPYVYFSGEDSFTYRLSDGTATSEIATVHVTVSQPGSQGFITGGGKFFQDGRKCTFGFVAKVQGNGVQGNLEFQDHDASMDVSSEVMQTVYAANSSDGYFGGTCTVNGAAGHTFFVQIHDRGEPGSNDDLTVWIFDSFNNPVYTADALLSGGNIVIHGH